MEKGALLKLGGRKHLGEYRWNDALNLFSEIHCTCLYREASCPIESDKVHFYEIKHNWINQRVSGILQRTKSNKKLDMISWLAVYVLRFANRDLLRTVKKLNAEKVLCSYGDYDWSDLSCIVFRNAVKAPIVRSYKESRVGYNFLEYNALKKADILSFYDIELKYFLERKYGPDLFKDKKVLIGNDENALPSSIVESISYQEKYSAKDGKIHMVILTFRVDSAPNRNRDQSRYYYIDVIQRMINAGLVVHLHCAQYNDVDGVNKYEELAKENPESFFMKPALEMKHDSSLEEWIHSCEVLSRYDIGLLHNIVEQSTVSEFDRINIPHRFFAYEAAHVAPVIQKGENSVLERIFKEYGCGFIYETLEDLKNVREKEFHYYTPTYEDYLKHIFNL